MAEREYSELKKRAMLAKQRLKMGYWQKMYDEKQRALESVGGSMGGVRQVNEMTQEKVKRDELRAMKDSGADADELFYCKVCAILERDENTTNPIGQLIDRNEFDNLDESNRQRYILMLAQKFREMRERYYRERTGKSG